MLTDRKGVGDFNVLPSLWVEDAETALLDTFESKFEINNICEYDIKSLKSDKIGIKYTYFSDVSLTTNHQLQYPVTNQLHSPNHAYLNPKSRTSPL